jgi:hypothetical protein
MGKMKEAIMSELKELVGEQLKVLSKIPIHTYIDERSSHLAAYSRGPRPILIIPDDKSNTLSDADDNRHRTLVRYVSAYAFPF